MCLYYYIHILIIFIAVGHQCIQKSNGVTENNEYHWSKHWGWFNSSLEEKKLSLKNNRKIAILKSSLRKRQSANFNNVGHSTIQMTQFLQK